MARVSAPTPHAPSLWEDGRERGREVVVLGVALALSAAALDVLLTDRLSLFFDLCFVAVCVLLALRVRPSDFFTIGVAPPLLLLGLCVLFAVSDPGVIARGDDGLVQAVVSGLAKHAGALAAGYAVALGVLAQRRRVLGTERD